MGNEATKTKDLHAKKIFPYLKGEGIDIGCGADPILPNAQPFDRAQGDANKVTQYFTKKFEYVFSSHALEHMVDARAAFKEWFALLKPGGYMVTIVPDEDLY